MSGLIMADCLAYKRRMGAFSMYFSYMVCAAAFLFLKNGIGLTLVTLVILPMGMANLPVMMKEIDSGQAYCRYLMTLPCTRQEIVQARFLATLLDGLKDEGLILAFLIIDALWRRTYPVQVYVQLWVASLMIGLIYMALNLLVSFMSNITVTSVVYLVTILGGVAVYLVVYLLDVPLDRLLSINGVLLWCCGLIVTVAVVAICYVISLKLFGRRR